MRPIIRESPAEELTVKCLRLPHIGRGELHIVNLPLTRHASPQSADSSSPPQLQLPSRCVDSPCSGTSFLRGLCEFHRVKDADCAREAGEPPESCRGCRNRIAA